MLLDASKVVRCELGLMSSCLLIRRRARFPWLSVERAMQSGIRLHFARYRSGTIRLVLFHLSRSGYWLWI